LPTEADTVINRKTKKTRPGNVPPTMPKPRDIAGELRTAIAAAMHTPDGIALFHRLEVSEPALARRIAQHVYGGVPPQPTNPNRE
jgi:hypothetical protein